MSIASEMIEQETKNIALPGLAPSASEIRIIAERVIERLVAENEQLRRELAEDRSQRILFIRESDEECMAHVSALNLRAEAAEKEVERLVEQLLICNVDQVNSETMSHGFEERTDAAEKENERLNNLLSIMTLSRDMWLRRRNEDLVRAEAAEKENERLNNLLSVMTENRDMWLLRRNEEFVRADAAEKENERLSVGVRELERRWSEARHDDEASEQKVERLKAQYFRCPMCDTQTFLTRMHKGKQMCGDCRALEIAADMCNTTQERDTLRNKAQELERALVIARANVHRLPPATGWQRDERDRLDRAFHEAKSRAHAVNGLNRYPDDASALKEAVAALTAIDANLLSVKEKK